VQRKVFRVEKMVAGAGNASAAVQYSQNEPHHPAEPKPAAEHEFTDIQDDIACVKRELSALINDGNERRMARAAGELGVAVEGMETATQKILASAEIIDDCARALASALTDEYHHGLTQDLQDHVVRIYEACNFQDLSGQRIGKVIGILMMVEERLAAMVERFSSNTESKRPAATGTSSSDGELINGPRIDGASGHATQQDIDAMFA
jgi:chemotaxis protein CheZ